MFKKLLVSIAMLVSLNSNAIVGIIADDDTTAVVGLAMMDISQITVVDTTVYRTRRSRFVYRTYKVFTYVPLFLAGLVVLDDAGKMTFNELSAEKALKAQITEAEATAFNSELEELNAVKDLVSSELTGLEGNKEQKAEAAKELWTEYQEYVSKDAFMALSKLVRASL